MSDRTEDDLARENERLRAKLAGLEQSLGKRGPDWMHCGFEMVRKYGILSAQISSGLIPREYREGINFEDLYRFTGRILKRCVERHLLEPKVEIREGVRFWFALVSPVRIQGCLDDGMSIEELEKQTLDAFLAVFSTHTGE